ncbi:hypothetical protein B0H13DRAFT_2302575 [Mycena leptocephala]|nr:hypothetical protein B0H13DRAFT_2302575 [Mycena leptocephala]
MSPQVISFLGITVTWIRDGHMDTLILDFVKASKALTGPYLAARISECLHDFGIQDKILSLIADNASNNNTMVDELSILSVVIGRGQSGWPALGLSPNVKVPGKPMLTVPTLSTEDVNPVEDEDDEGDGPDSEDLSDEIDPSVQESDYKMVDDLNEDLEFHSRLPEWAASELKLGYYALADKIINSPTIKEDLAAACTRSKSTPRLMICEVPTRWNSTAELIKRAIELRDALTLLVVMEEHTIEREGFALIDLSSVSCSEAVLRLPKRNYWVTF